MTLVEVFVKKILHLCNCGICLEVVCYGTLLQGVQPFDNDSKSYYMLGIMCNQLSPSRLCYWFVEC